MKLHTFIADTAVQAVDQIRDQLGPEAVVVNVRKLPGEGLARLWQKPRIEVLAFLPEAPAETQSSELSELRQELAEFKQHVLNREPSRTMAETEAESRNVDFAINHASMTSEAPSARAAEPQPWSPGLTSRGGTRPTLAALLEKSGLFPIYVQRVLDDVHGRNSGVTEGCPAMAEELKAARDVLVALWPLPEPLTSNTHLFIGPSGSGKTTVLSKWLAQAVLLEGRRARVWRLDSDIANTAECLSVFAEILSVPVERTRTGNEPPDPTEMMFVDLPGVNWKDAAALKELGLRLAQMGGAQVHLVLNAAYEGNLLMAQGRAFASLPVDDVILTHLDEDGRWGKLWNFVLGTNYRVRVLSAGQNIPGAFEPADPKKILAPHLR
jgi:flagellar biosynthesis protein FlhF